MFLHQTRLGVFAAIGALLLSPPALAHKAKMPASAKSNPFDAAAYWEARALGYWRELAKKHGELVELERKCGKKFIVWPDYGAMPLESSKP
jgi:hypothetical protein